MGQVKNFDADFGGTEIFEPLQEIFKQIKQTEKKTNTTKMTHIYLLTDGAVDNTSDIINLVKKNCNEKVKVHTFGVGSGADESLIKGCAREGRGNFSFIYNDNEIERKVIESLSKTKLDWVLINECKILDEDDNVISEMPGLPISLEPGTQFNYETLLVGK